MRFRTPVRDMLFAARIAGADAPALAILADLLGPAGRLAEEGLAPLDPVGDRVGARFEDGAVTLPPGFAAFYRQWAADGWNGVDAPEAWGGQGLPLCVSMPLMELWTAASMGFGLGPVLTQGAVEVLLAHGDAALQACWLPGLVAGTCTATMALTEPGAGSDLNLIRTRAERVGDGRYRLRGQKIFITYGEHDLTGNIVHLVLARLPDAPAGTRGLSLFLVPKLLPDGGRNDVRCLGIEHKLGVHASPTCTMQYGEEAGALGWIVGGEHRGLACMFTMMNRARLATGLQGVAVAERATQAAAAHAAQRRQGSARKGGEPLPIGHHPDVRRMLADMRSRTLACRMLAYAAAVSIDRAQEGDDGTRAALLTPIVKAFCADSGFAVASTVVQVHGGAGYVEETGVARHLRDVRVTAIYEGTNGIQAIDLVQRKITRPGAVRTLLAELRDDAAAADRHGLADSALLLSQALDATAITVNWLLDESRSDEDRLAGATPFLDLMGRVLAASLLLRGAVMADASAPPDIDGLARFFCHTQLAPAPGIALLVRAGGAVLSPTIPDFPSTASMSQRD